MGQIILIEAGLSFLGIGVPRPVPSWGVMIADGQREGLLTAAPWIAGFPGGAIVITVIAFSLLGDALHDALNPRIR
jgi:peptide/nickel transport system permease protein